MENTSKGKKIGYWILTGLVAFAMLGGGVADILQPAEFMEGFLKLGYPAYVATMLGVFKLLGAVAILVPGLPRIKEWAYAGIAFDLIGATVSHLVVDGPAQAMSPIILGIILVGSYLLRPAGRRFDVSATPSAVAQA